MRGVSAAVGAAATRVSSATTTSPRMTGPYPRRASAASTALRRCRSRNKALEGRRARLASAHPVRLEAGGGERRRVDVLPGVEQEPLPADAAIDVERRGLGARGIGVI